MGDTKFRQTGRRTARGPYRRDAKEVRIEEGQERNKRWAALSTAQKIAELDRRLGSGLGARRQRRKLRGDTT